MRITRLLAALALLMAVATGSLAQPFNVFDVTASTTTAFAPLAANSSITSKVFSVSQFREFGLSWYLVPAAGSPSVNVIVLQANAYNDGLAQWSNPVTVTALSPMPTNDVTLTTARGGSTLVLHPSALLQLRINNTSATQAVTPTVRLYAR